MFYQNAWPLFTMNRLLIQSQGQCYQVQGPHTECRQWVWCVRKWHEADVRGVILASSVPKGPPFKLLLLFFTHTLSIYYTLSGVFVQYPAKWTKKWSCISFSLGFFVQTFLEEILSKSRQVKRNFLVTSLTQSLITLFIVLPSWLVC